MTTKPSAVTLALVARRSNVDPSLIRYYFNDRSTLLVAAAERITQEFVWNLQPALETCEPTPDGRLRARVGTLVDLEARYPFFHQLFIEEVLEADSPAARALKVGLTERAAGNYAAILKAGAQSGEFREVDARLLFVSIIGMCEFFTSAVKLLGLIEGRSIRPEDARVEYKEFICDLIINGIKALPTDRKRRVS